MPFTPFHFGPGLLAKAAAPRRFSFTSFALTQVVVDVETLYYMVQREWPVHRQAHSVVGGAVVGLVVAVVVVRGRALFERIVMAVAGTGGKYEPLLVAETSGEAAAIGGLIGGTSHAVLDGIFHLDGVPFWPFADNNPLSGLIGPSWLQGLCVLAGILGAGILWLGVRKRSAVAGVDDDSPVAE